MSENKITKKISEKLNTVSTTKLFDIYEKASKLYYEFGSSVYNDEEFDMIKNELERRGIETEVGYKLDKTDSVHQPYEHLQPKLSLKDVWTGEDVFKFLKLGKFSNGTKLDGDYPFIDRGKVVFEYKIDGINATFRYVNGNLTNIATRGDGIVGKDITHIKPLLSEGSLIDYIPAFNGEINGEIYISKRDFKEICEFEQKEYANCRNLTAGTVNSKSIEDISHRKLSFIAYDIIPEDNNLNDFVYYYEKQDLLTTWGFNLPQSVYVPGNKIENIIKEMYNNKGNIPYEVDGIVFKIDNVEEFENRGKTKKFPKGAVAFKFKEEEFETEIYEIIDSVAKSGKITPVAIIKPVKIEGTTIKKVTLYNYDWVKKHDIYIGKTVKIVKSGGIIPKIVV